MNTRQIEIGGKNYTLTSKRSLVVAMSRVAPELIKIAKSSRGKDVSDEEQDNLTIDFSVSIYDHIDVLFYEMIKIAHPNITKEKSDDIYNAFCREYNDVDEHLVHFLHSSFTDGIPREQKKTLNW